MDSGARGGFLIGGSVIGFIGFIVPGIYGVGYSPPAHSSYERINLGNLKSFGGSGSLSGSREAVFNGFGGPVDFHPALWALAAMAAIGMLVVGAKVDFGSAEAAVKHSARILGFKLASVAAEVFVVANFIWAFRFNRTPPAITSAFIKDLGGTSSAIAASHYLAGQLGLGALILLFGLLLGLAGVTPKLGCTLLVLFVLTFIGLYIYASVAMGGTA